MAEGLTVCGLRRRSLGRNAVIAALSFTVALSGCGQGANGPRGDDEQIVHAVLALIARDGVKTCVDRATKSTPLAAYRVMLAAPDAARAPLGWRTPTPLRPPSVEVARGIAHDRFATVSLDADGQLLPRVQQQRIDAVASALAGTGADARPVTIGRWAPPGVTPRWWLRTLLSPPCARQLALATPVRDRAVGFVTVNDEHWGTTYALERRGADWVPIGRWSSWLQ